MPWTWWIVSSTARALIGCGSRTLRTSPRGPGSCIWRWCWMCTRVVGWAMETHLKTELILAALNMAITQRHPTAVIHHSDQGCQYTSYAFGKRCQEAGVMPSMGSVGDAYDNAMTESFFATLERELLNRRRFRSQAEAKMAVFEWIEGWYNPRRRHSSLGYRSPVNYERAHERSAA